MRHLSYYVTVACLCFTLRAHAISRLCGITYRNFTRTEAFAAATSAVRRTDLHTHFAGILPFERMAFLYANEIANVPRRVRETYRQPGARDTVDAEKRILLQRICELVLSPSADLPESVTRQLARIGGIREYLEGRREAWAKEDWWKNGNFDKGANFHQDIRFWRALPEETLNSTILRVSRAMPETPGANRIQFDDVYALNTALLQDFRSNARDPKAASDAVTREVANYLRDQGVDFAEVSMHHGIFFATERDERGRTRPLIDEHAGTDANLRLRWLAGVTNDFLWRNNPRGRGETIDRLRDVISKRNDVNGIDIFGGESHRIDANPRGYEAFKDMFDLLKEQARGTRKLAYRIHIGEGYASGDATHRETARANVETMLGYLEKLQRDEKYDFTKGPVIFRLGHFTAATPEQVRRAAALGVTLEFPLTSNIVTGALPPAPGGGSVLDGHPILQAIFSQAKFVLATDGHTVSHSTLHTELQRMAFAVARFTSGEVKIDVGRGVMKAYSELNAEEKARFDNAFHTLNENTNDYRARMGQARR